MASQAQEIKPEETPEDLERQLREVFHPNSAARARFAPGASARTQALLITLPVNDTSDRTQSYLLMDHRYIEEYSVAERYLDNQLGLGDRAAFEAHLVDCQECTDRVLLAGMFHARQNKPVPAPLPQRSRFVAQFKPWQILMIFAVMALLLLAIPTAYFLWQLHLAWHAPPPGQ